ncbi:hypothetical protein BISA_1371 [Bifidobacterium saguini DSM 23967]|uniref:Uncharacterized protein n=1 Tax=Bifidobacterium saguini DSM 23967 TaxID=1437607 RepID=A0A087DCF5_9BIFI|nr:hypothetical protein [Bifidobacterium saguini]KFI93205.1 hypothetical protein BISA_1371 [Bifidobacterium saguini DSM 23967]
MKGLDLHFGEYGETTLSFTPGAAPGDQQPTLKITLDEDTYYLYERDWRPLLDLLKTMDRYDHDYQASPYAAMIKALNIAELALHRGVCDTYTDKNHCDERNSLNQAVAFIELAQCAVDEAYKRHKTTETQ